MSQHVHDAVGEQPHRRLLELSEATRLGDHCWDAGRGGRTRGHPGEATLLRLLADDVRKPERCRDSVRGVLDVRRLVDRERLERLDQITAVEIEQHVGRRDQLVEDRASECIGEAARRRAGKAAIQVLAVLRDDERGAALIRLHADNRDGQDRTGQLARVELAHHAYDRRDRRVLAAVDAADQRQAGTVRGTAGLEGRVLGGVEQRVLEPDDAAFDHRLSWRISGVCGAGWAPQAK